MECIHSLYLIVHSQNAVKLGGVCISVPSFRLVFMHLKVIQISTRTTPGSKSHLSTNEKTNKVFAW